MKTGHGCGAWGSFGRLATVSIFMAAAPVGLPALADETVLAEQAKELGVPGADGLAVDTAGTDDTAPEGLDVPTEARTLKLRELWRSTPGFGAPDGLSDYNGDFATVQPIRR